MFEELDYQETPLGSISLRRRSEPRLNNRIVYEVKMNEEFLMSSLFYEAELQLSYLGLAALDRDDLDVVVGGLGLGYTAAAALEDDRVRSVRVIEVMEPIIGWHKRNLVPMARALTYDDRCHLELDDFFAWALDGERDQGALDAILLDIDHTPKHWLTQSNSRFYSLEGLQAMAAKLKPGGVFGLWSDDDPDPEFIALLEQVFDTAKGEQIRFPNPYLGGESTNGVYVATIA